VSVKTLTHVDPFDSAPDRAGAAVFGMWVFIAVVGMIFVATVLGYLVVRFDRPPGMEWMPQGTPGLPHALALSTALLVVSSWTMQGAVRAAREGRTRGVSSGLSATLALAVAFLAIQTLAWAELWRRQATIDSGLYAWTFYVLTGLHALHVLGGLPPMAIALHRAHRGLYTATDHAGLVLCAMYWHALDVIWVVLYATLLAFSN
jgi:cytochrome c oxidase subunit 3